MKVHGFRLDRHYAYWTRHYCGGNLLNLDFQIQWWPFLRGEIRTRKHGIWLLFRFCPGDL